MRGFLAGSNSTLAKAVNAASRNHTNAPTLSENDKVKLNLFPKVQKHRWTVRKLSMLVRRICGVQIPQPKSDFADLADPPIIDRRLVLALSMIESAW